MCIEYFSYRYYPMLKQNAIKNFIDKDGLFMKNGNKF